MTGSPANTVPAACILVPPGAPEVRVWGLSSEERLRRSLTRLGCTSVDTSHAERPAAADPDRALLLLRSDWIYDERLVTALAEQPGALLVVPTPTPTPVAAHAPAGSLHAAWSAVSQGTMPADPGLQSVTPDRLAPAYTAKLRKSEPPYLLPARADAAAEIEARTFSASYKGATDLVTKWVWPLPARAATRWLARAGVHPNVVTLASWVLAVLAFALFWRGQFGAGLLAAWAMTFLDTVDGKLARVTLTSSRLADVLDHSLDLIHPPFWWFAWGVGIQAATAPATLIVVAGYFAGRLLEGLFLLLFRFETHSWRPIDALFRTVTARRNPNLLLLSVGAVAGRADLGMQMVALWTLASLGFHAVRLVQAGLARRRGGSVTPFDEDRAAAARPTADGPSEQGAAS
jgi:phosphatidylglycerophosphate synthase